MSRNEITTAQSESILIARTPTTRNVWGEEGAGKDAMAHHLANMDTLPMFFSSEPDLAGWFNTREDARIETGMFRRKMGSRPVVSAALMGL